MACCKCKKNSNELSNICDNDCGAEYCKECSSVDSSNEYCLCYFCGKDQCYYCGVVLL